MRFAPVCALACLLVCAAVRPQSGSVGSEPTQDVLLQDLVGGDGSHMLAQGFSTSVNFTTLAKGKACSEGQFERLALELALLVEWCLHRAQRSVDMIASEFQSLDDKFKLANLDQTSVLTYEDFKECPATCKHCVGRKVAQDTSGREIAILPQNERTGDAYAYRSRRVRSLKSAAELLVDKARINKGLRYATLRPALQNVDDYLTPGLTSGLRYLGNDPAIYLLLAPPHGNGSRVDSESLCLQGDNDNLMEHRLFDLYFSTTKPRPNLSSHSRTYWSREFSLNKHASSTIATLNKVAFDREGEPMGIVAMDLNVSYLVKAIDTIDFTPHTYVALVVSTSGMIFAINKRGRDELFYEGMPEEEMILHRNASSKSCDFGTAKDHSKTCSFGLHVEYKKLADLMEDDRYSGANFASILRRLESGRLPCSLGLSHTSFVTFPKRGQEEHMVAYCSFGAANEWSIIVGTRYADIVEAAGMKISSLTETEQDSVTLKADSISVSHAIGVHNEERLLQLMLSNTGRVTLPYQVSIEGGLERIEHLDVFLTPTKGLLQAGENVTLNLSMHIHTTDPPYGKVEGIIVVRAARGSDNNMPFSAQDFEDEATMATTGHCFSKPGHFRVSIKVQSQWQFYFKRVRAPVFLGLTLFLIGLFAYAVVLMTKKYFTEHTRQQEIINQTRKGLNSIEHPMVLMEVRHFKTAGHLMKHEDAQERKLLTWCYTVSAVAALNSLLVFISHQWTAFDAPDPTKKQYDAMVDSIDNVVRLENVIALREHMNNEIYIWADYSCIPQTHAGLQALAINSLPWYASQVHVFVIVAPPIQHEDLNTLCDRNSYQCRAWCRAEQLSHLLAKGPDNMFLAEGNVLNKLSPQWLQKSLHVFNGELTCCKRQHVGMPMCDKQKLMLPMLSLWAQLCSMRDEPDFEETFMLMSRELDSIFPPTFAFETAKGTSTRKLFGNLAHIVLQDTLVREKGEENPWNTAAEYVKVTLAKNGKKFDRRSTVRILATDVDGQERMEKVRTVRSQKAS